MGYSGSDSGSGSSSYNPGGYSSSDSYGGSYNSNGGYTSRDRGQLWGSYNGGGGK